MLAKKLGSCVDRARPYYQARREAKEVKTSKSYVEIVYVLVGRSHISVFVAMGHTTFVQSLQ